MHVGLVGLDGVKMSKSSGQPGLRSRPGSQRSESAAVRLALLDHHYREDWEWRDELLSRAQSRLATWRTTLTGRSSNVLDDVRGALDDDLDTPSALRAIDAAAHAGLTSLRPPRCSALRCNSER
jgi:L-cysteine:1D-myo-inositol 2-amino-2-deoxy-alpha-D-glucopyranoside ligase